MRRARESLCWAGTQAVADFQVEVIVVFISGFEQDKAIPQFFQEFLGLLAHGVSRRHGGPFIVHHTLDVVGQGSAKVLGLGQGLGEAVGRQESVGLPADIGLGGEEGGPEGDDGEAQEKGVDGGEKREDRGVQVLDGQAGGNEAAAQEIEQASEEQTDGQNGAKDQEKHFHLATSPVQAWSSS